VIEPIARKIILTMFKTSTVSAPLTDVLQPCLRRIYPPNFTGNRILAIRPVLSWAT
jgi:hypothetical protein